MLTPWELRSEEEPMATQAGITKLEAIKKYLYDESLNANRLGDRLFAVTDAAVIVNAKIAELILNNNYGE